MTITVEENGAIYLPVELLRRLGVTAGSRVVAEANERGVLLRPTESPNEQSLLEVFDQAIAGLPPEVVTQWPSDAAEEHDHYIYGIPKKNGA